MGFIIYTKKMTLTLSEKKLKKVPQRCQEVFTQPKTLPCCSPVKSILAAQIQFWHLQQEQILALRKKESYTTVMWHGEFSHGGSPLVDEKFEALQREPHMIIQTDDFTQGWWIILQGSFVRGNNQRRRSVFT